jgi:phytoene dehydrogenase-like protein
MPLVNPIVGLYYLLALEWGLLVRRGATALGQPDVVVVGGGHNGLVAANYLAKAGRHVVVLERRQMLGGACVSEELVPGAKFSTCAYVVSSLRPEIIRELELKRFGLEVYATDVLNFVMGADGSHFFVWPELDRTLSEIGKLSKHDSETFIDFGIRFQRFAQLVAPLLLQEPPTLSDLVKRFEDAGSIDLWHEFVTISVGDMLDRYFESDLLKGLFMFFALVSVHAGPYSPGTAYEFSHHSWGEYEGEFGRFGFARGGMGAITEALANGARHHGAELQTGVEVKRIVVDRGVVQGVELADGSVLRAPAVLSNADPRRTYLNLIDPRDLKADFLESARRIDMRGSMARVHMLVDELPHYKGLPAGEGPQHRGFSLVGATPADFERGWQAQLRGELMDDYPIEMIIQSVTDPTLAPAGLHTITTGIQQLPFELAEGTWDSRREEFTERVVRSLSRFAPNLEGSIRGSYTLTPLDIEREYGLTGGNIFHGAMFTNQLFASRPIPGWGGYRTPIKGLYLCGAGTHPGGAVMGAPGHNAAFALIADGENGQGPKRVTVAAATAPGLVQSMATSSRMRGFRSWAVRQPWLRPVVRSFTRSDRRGR